MCHDTALWWVFKATIKCYIKCWVWTNSLIYYIDDFYTLHFKLTLTLFYSMPLKACFSGN